MLVTGTTCNRIPDYSFSFGPACFYAYIVNCGSFLSEACTFFDSIFELFLNEELDQWCKYNSAAAATAAAANTATDTTTTTKTTSYSPSARHVTTPNSICTFRHVHKIVDSDC